MDTPLLYFAYGSNMNPKRIAARIPGAKDLGPAELLGYRVTERLYADIDAVKGASTWGVLYMVSKADIAELDRFEGAPTIYERRTVEVVYRGEHYFAETYEMTPQTKIARHWQPYPDSYRRLCSDGAELHHIPNHFLIPMQKPTINVAVYGTLLAGEHNSSLIPIDTPRTPCTIKGTLFDTGYGYPAFDPKSTKDSKNNKPVQAELVTVSPEVFGNLDRLEGYPHLYTRKQIYTYLPDGTKKRAWVYIMRDLPANARIIESGSWREYRCR